VINYVICCHFVISLSQGGARHRNMKKKISVTKSVNALFITIYLS
jgi:hypothetical protein